tara:strand:- start:1239 stop:1352 length:114 start_codon:yes stop_codon:yes gene_type:complete
MLLATDDEAVPGRECRQAPVSQSTDDRAGSRKALSPD